jgi:DNA-binding XRE family transcriptional regulator
MRISNAIYSMRKSRGIHQEELAEKIGIQRYILSAIETGQVMPTWTTLLDISRALDCLVTDLYSAKDLERVYEKV